MLSEFYVKILNDWVAKDHAAHPIFTEKEVQTVIAKGLKYNSWNEVMLSENRILESRLEGFSSSMVTEELRKILHTKRVKGKI